MSINLRNFISVSLTLMAFVPFTAQAMSKDEGIRLCLKELKIKQITAKQCKDGNWRTQECIALKKRIKPCVMSKMGY